MSRSDGALPRLVVIGLALGLVGCLWLGTGWHLWQKALVVEEEARHALESVCRLIAQRLAADYAVSELQLLTLRAHIDEHPDQPPMADPDLPRLFSVFSARHVDNGALLLVDRQGFAHGLAGRHRGREIDLSDRDYVRVALAGPLDQLVIGTPIDSRFDPGQRHWPVALRLTGDRPWAGALVTWIDAERVMAAITEARPGRSATLALIRRDGAVIAAAQDRRPQQAVMVDWLAQRVAMDGGAVPAEVGGPALWADAGSGAGIHLLGRASLAPYPLVVTGAIEQGEVYAQWRAEAWILIGLMALLTLATLGGMAWVLHLMARLRRNNCDLERQVAERTQALSAEIEQHRQTEGRVRRLSLAVDSSASMVILTDADYRVEYVNPAFTAHTGFAPAEVVGRTTEFWRSPNRAPEVTAEMAATLAAGKVWRGELLHRHREGFDFWAAATVTPVHLETCGERFLVAVEEDISERRAREAELERAKAAAEQANRAKSEFLSAMSHELRTPLNAVLGFAQLLLGGGRGSLNEHQRGYVDRIVAGGDHLVSLINDVLDLARVESGSLKLSLEAVNLEPVLESALGMIEACAAERQVTVIDATGSAGGDGQTLPVVRADAIRLRQVLLNLLSNAVKYNRRGGTVTLSASLVEDRRVRLTVSDTGHGIPAACWPVLFQPFQRLGFEHSAIEGTGIGLAVSRNLVQVMGGTLSFTSEEGVGSSFWIELPVTSPPALLDQPEAIPDLSAPYGYSEHGLHAGLF